MSIHKKTLRTLPYVDIETPILVVVTTARATKLPVTMSIIPQKALKLRDQLMEKATKEIQKQHIHRFVASRGWVTNYTMGHAFRSVCFWEQAASAISQSIAFDMSALRRKI